MSDTPIRVLIVDDHPVVRNGLRRVLESEVDIEVVGEAGDAQHAVFEALAQKPDLILMDVVMPGKSGIEAIPDVLHDAPEAKVLILSMQDDPNYVRQAFAAGATGYILKEAADTDLVAAVREVAAGRNYVHPTLGARMVVAEAEERKRSRSKILSQTESATSYAYSPSATPTRRSPTSSLSRCAPLRPTARTSCRSCASPPAPSSFVMPSGTASWTPTRSVSRTLGARYRALECDATLGPRPGVDRDAAVWKSAHRVRGRAPTTAGQVVAGSDSRQTRSTNERMSAAGAPRNPLARRRPRRS